jgi:hypothetical protein
MIDLLWRLTTCFMALFLIGLTIAQLVLIGLIGVIIINVSCLLSSSRKIMVINLHDDWILICIKLLRAYSAYRRPVHV